MSATRPFPARALTATWRRCSRWRGGSTRPVSLTSEFRKSDFLLVTHLPSLRYLTGFSGSAGCAFLTPRLNLFFTDFRYRGQAIREVKGFDVHIVNGGALEGCCRYIKVRRLKTGVIGYDGDHLTLRQFQLMKKQLKGLSFLDASGEIEQRRQVKKPR